MSLQPMRLFDAITTPGAAVCHMSFGPQVEPLTQPELNMFIQARRVWVDESLKRQVDFTARTVDFRRDFGELRLPFPHLWIEWSDPTFDSLAAQCVEAKPQQRDELSYLLIPWFFNQHSNDPRLRGVPTESDHVLRVDFNKSGQILGVSGYGRRGRSISVLTKSELGAAVDLVWDALVAIGFMNCRNVTTERHERPTKAGKKQRRPRPPKLDYHTIVLPSANRGGGEGAGESKQLRAQHQVRGHFKSFTPERPLMGKHIGTYWWGWQVRGNKDNGLIISDYKVGAR